MIALISHAILILPCHVTTHTNFPVTMIESIPFTRAMQSLQDLGNAFPFSSSWRLAFEHGPLLSLFKVPDNLFSTYLGLGVVFYLNIITRLGMVDKKERMVEEWWGGMGSYVEGGFLHSHSSIDKRICDFLKLRDISK